MPDKLNLLLGTVPRKFAPALAGFTAASFSVPTQGMDAYSPVPASGVWATVVDVTGKGRLRGVVLSTTYVAGSVALSLRITIDGTAYTKSVNTGGNPAYITLAEALVGAGQLSLAPSLLFFSSLKVEVMRASGTATPLALYELHELEV